MNHPLTAGHAVQAGTTGFHINLFRVLFNALATSKAIDTGFFEPGRLGFIYYSADNDSQVVLGVADVHVDAVLL